MIIYKIDQTNGYYAGTMEVPDDPDNIFGIPIGTTKKTPPELKDGEYAVWEGSNWYISLNPPPQPIPIKEVPEFITKYQAKMALLQAGIFEQVEDYVSNSDNIALKIAWYDADNFYRNNDFIISLGEQFSLTDAQIDDLFILGKTF